jgi:hypothetical protein
MSLAREARTDVDADHENGRDRRARSVGCVCQTLAALLKISEVRIAVGGTGCERSDFQPGSTDTTSTLIHATTHLWKDLTRNKPFLAPYANLMRATPILTRKDANITETHRGEGSATSTNSGASLQTKNASGRGASLSCFYEYS